jgi:hypothetical protein
LALQVQHEGDNSPCHFLDQHLKMAQLKDGNLFSKATQCLFYNYKPKPAQRMLDFDFLCGEWPSGQGAVGDSD